MVGNFGHFLIVPKTMRNHCHLPLFLMRTKANTMALGVFVTPIIKGEFYTVFPKKITIKISFFVHALVKYQLFCKLLFIIIILITIANRYILQPFFNCRVCVCVCVRARVYKI